MIFRLAFIACGMALALVCYIGRVQYPLFYFAGAIGFIAVLLLVMKRGGKRNR
jgi:hypothetical protein